jgi:hypothetical protein
MFPSSQLNIQDEPEIHHWLSGTKTLHLEEWVRGLLLPYSFLSEEHKFILSGLTDNSWCCTVFILLAYLEPFKWAVRQYPEHFLLSAWPSHLHNIVCTDVGWAVWESHHQSGSTLGDMTPSVDTHGRQTTHDTVHLVHHSLLITEHVMDPSYYIMIHSLAALHMDTNIVL